MEYFASNRPHLTWHRGSVLPYSSLWHTLQRMAALNELRAIEVPRGGGKQASSSTIGSYQQLLFDADSCVNVKTLAKWLDEPIKAFRWSHFGALPPGMRFLVTGYFRLCPLCIEEGYQSALLSLRMLRVCPIHGCALIENCLCKKPLMGELRDKDTLRSCSCDCGKMSFLTLETCRRPTLKGEATQAFYPIAKWLERIRLVRRPLPDTSAERSSNDEAWIQSIQQWSEALKIPYPAAFMGTSGNEGFGFIEYIRGKVGTKAKQLTLPTTFSKERLRPDYWQETPSVWTYRAMSRYLRRHVVRRSEYWCLKFEDAYDPIEISKLIGKNETARLAYIEMLWAQHVEPPVHHRRWPGRQTPEGPGGRVVGELRLPWVSWDGHVVNTAPQLDSATRDWVEYHVAEIALLAIWERCMIRACEDAKSSVADWSYKPLREVEKSSWCLVFSPNGRAKFVSFARPLWPLVQRESTTARQLRHEFQQRKFEIDATRRIWTACKGPCLTWSSIDGWTVIDSACPGIEGGKLHRLLGLPDLKLKVWLFEHNGQFVARLTSIGLQVFGDCPSEAFCQMRKCIRQYLKTYGTPPNQIMSVGQSNRDELSPEAKIAHEIYRYRLWETTCKDGFWKSGRAASSAARAYLTTRV